MLDSNFHLRAILQIFGEQKVSLSEKEGATEKKKRSNDAAWQFRALHCNSE